MDCSQSEMKKRDCTNRVITNRIKLTQYFHMVSETSVLRGAYARPVEGTACKGPAGCM